MTAETWARIKRQLLETSDRGTLYLTSVEAVELFTLTRGSPFAALAVGPGDVRMMATVTVHVLPDLTTTTTTEGTTT